MTRPQHPGWLTVARSSGKAPAQVPRRRRARSRSVPISVNIAPMIDVTFLLLIFFLVTTTFALPEGILASKLPADAPPSVSLPISPIVVRISQFGPSPEDCSIKIDNFDRIPGSFEELAALLRVIQQQPGFDNQTPVVIKATDDARWDHVVNAWNAAVRCGYQNIAFSG